MDYIADTGFIIGRWRGSKNSPEESFITRHPADLILIPWIVKAEFLRGATVASHDPAQVISFLNRFGVLWPDDDTIAIYVRIYSVLYRANSMIGPHDLWIAATALQHRLPLLTRNVSEFQRVPELRVHDYLHSTG